jgi:hypothetical protein
MKSHLMSVLTLSLTALLSTPGAQAQEPTPKGCFKFSDKWPISAELTPGFSLN